MAVRAAVKRRWKRGCGGETLRRFRTHWPGLSKTSRGLHRRPPLSAPQQESESVEYAAPARRTGKSGNIPTRNSSDMRASPDPADWRDARSQCHTGARDGAYGKEPTAHPWWPGKAAWPASKLRPSQPTQGLRHGATPKPQDIPDEKRFGTSARPETAKHSRTNMLRTGGRRMAWAYLRDTPPAPGSVCVKLALLDAGRGAGHVPHGNPRVAPLSGKRACAWRTAATRIRKTATAPVRGQRLCD